MLSLNAKISKTLEPLKPFKDIFWFLFLFVFFDFLWKLFIDEGDNEELLIILGKDFTKSIEPLCIWTADISHWIVQNVLGYKDFNIKGDIIYFADSLRFKIVWGCTGFKQMIMFVFIMILYFGPVKKKLWFIPLSVLFLNFINIIRIISTVLLTKGGYPDWFIPFNEWLNGRQWDNSPETIYQFNVDWFQLFHKEIFKWLYYDGVMFLLWLLWEEVFNLPYQRKKKKLAEKEKAPA